MALFERWRPDRVVIGTTLTVFLSARVAGVPLVYVRPYAMSRGHLARMTTFPLTHGQTLIAERMNRVAGRVIGGVAPRIRWKPASFRRVAAEYQLPLPPRTLDALDADLNLVASLFPYLDRRPLAPGEVPVGPIYAEAEGELPERVAALAESPRPVIYVGLGSSASRELALEVLHQLAGLDVDLLSSAGRYLRDSDHELLPCNVDVYDFLPAHRLTGIIDASVIHGGEGTVQTACASGAPFAGVGLQAEQRLNIDECVEHGNALCFTPRDLRRGRLPGIVSALLTDTSLRRTARELQQAAQPVGSAAAAQAIIETDLLLRSSRWQ